MTWLRLKRNAKRKARLKAKRDDYVYWKMLIDTEEKCYSQGFQEGLLKGLQENYQEAYQTALRAVNQKP